jgi:hypothetical protein
VTDMRPAAGVVHAVGEVAHQGHLFAVFGHLAQAEWAASDTHVHMHTQ